jgi:hypothetical protein
MSPFQHTMAAMFGCAILMAMLGFVFNLAFPQKVKARLRRVIGLLAGEGSGE